MFIKDTDKAYIAGFLDGDGCLMLQLVKRKGYKLGFQVRASIVFYQKSKYHHHLEWIKRKLYHGYTRKRKDGISEYTIVGLKPVYEIIQRLEPYIHIKRSQVSLMTKILNNTPKNLTAKTLLETAKLIDEFAKLNYSKKRKNTAMVVEEYLKKEGRLSP